MGRGNSRFEPRERGADVVDFPDTAGVLAFAQASAAKVEAENGESEAVEHFHRMENDFVVQRASVKRMRMADEGGVSCGGGTGVEQGFEAAGGAVEEQGPDGGGVGGHGHWPLVVGRSGLAVRRSVVASAFGDRFQQKSYQPPSLPTTSD